MRNLFLVGVLLVSLTGCQSIYNSAMEGIFKVEKRELLKGAVESVSKSQKKAQEEFKDALTQMKEMYNFQGGQVEAMYGKLKAAYEASEGQANHVEKRIENMQNVAKSMFAEWEKEIKEFENPAFAANSQKQLAGTKSRYGKLLAAVKNSQKSMMPILKQLKDHVLYLKHNLNAQAIGALKGEAASIQIQISELIKAMNASIQEADVFVQELLKN